MTATPTTAASILSKYLAENPVSPEQIQLWIETFHQQSFLFIENVLPLE
ncbi:MAG: hypothetical protein AAF702_49845 [Chloroflexota bacterium]